MGNAQLISAVSRDSGVHTYGKWRGAFWRLVSLVDLTTDALDLLEEKRLPDGTWRVEGRWWKRPGAKGSNVEAVDWDDAAKGLLTERAHDVVVAAGRE